METNTEIKNEIKELKASQYNIIFKTSDNTPLIFNTKSGAFSVIKSEQNELTLNEILKNPNLNYDKEPHKSMYKNLQNGFFLIDKKIDELKILKTKYNKGLYNNNFLGLTICTTEQCNFNCDYCFETNKERNYYLNERLENKIREFVEKNIKNKKIDFLKITWFGGEPLLNFNSISKLSQKFLQICQDNSVDYRALIVTNGYLLNREKALKLKEYNVSSYQITIDGDKETHDKRRTLKNNKGTYEKIMKNIEDIVDIDGIIITLRVNVDKKNMDRVKLLIDDLLKRGLKNKVKLDIAKVVDDYADLKNENYCNESLLKDNGWAEYYLQIVDKIKELGWNIKVRKYRPKYYTYCGAVCYNYFVIGADGNVYKCPEDIGKERLLGNLLDNDELLYLNSNSEYLEYSPFDNKECRECIYLPICLGGCPAKSMILNKKGKMACDDVKFMLNRTLEEHYKDYKKTKNNI